MDLRAAYVLGHSVRIRVRRGEEKPGWVTGLDPLEVLFLGAAWPEHYEDSYRFANACGMWLRVLRGTPYWDGIGRFAREALAVSREFDLAVGSDEMYGPLRERLGLARDGFRKLPPDLLPGVILRGARCLHGPARDLRLPGPPPDAGDLVKGFWAATGGFSRVPDGTEVTALGGLTAGLHRLRADGALGGLGRHSYGSVGLLKALYAGLVLPAGENLPPDLINRALAWALGLPAESPLVPVVDVLLISTERGLETEDALGRLFGVPEFGRPVQASDREWRSSIGTALRRLAPELG